MDLNHTFSVPASLDETWKTFEDIESVAGCFPGAQVTEVDGDNFKGTCKVKLGPIAMVYSGTGTFVEKDESARRFVIDAKGKDKRGNGTAGAMVTAVLTDDGGSTRVDVSTDLAITGKPAQFGRGVIEDISNKLLQQFVTCLQDRVGAPTEPAGEPTEELAPGATAPEAGPAAVGPAASAPVDQPAGTAEEPTGPSRPTPTGTAAPTAGDSARAAGPVRATGSSAPADDALDLGATVLPILVRTYGPPAAIGLVALLVGYLVGRRRR